MDAVTRPGGHFGSRTQIRAVVHNRGGEAEFSAQASLRSDQARSYATPNVPLPSPAYHDVAWSDVTDARLSIGHDQRKKLYVMETFITPQTSFWFVIPKNAETNPDSHGFGIPLTPTGRVVLCDLLVTNHDTNEAISRTGRVAFAENGIVSGFTLDEARSRKGSGSSRDLPQALVRRSGAAHPNLPLVG
jgi:hypothetical protein